MVIPLQLDDVCHLGGKIMERDFALLLLVR